MIVVACKKQETGNSPKSAPIHRTIQFVFYTNKDVSGDQHNISFDLFIENSKHDILWDSALAPMKVKDIPAAENKIIVQKLVPNDDNSLLKVGFHYSIEDVGNSSHFEPSIPGQVFKIVDFNFQ